MREINFSSPEGLHIKRTLLALSLGLAVAAASLAAAVAAPTTAFIGPPGWSHADQSPDPNSKLEQWRFAAGDVQTLTYRVDPSTSYTDALAAIHKMLTDNKFKPSIDKDVTCQGLAAHQVEFVPTGPDGHRIAINRIIVPNGNGNLAIIYVREEGQQFDPDARKAISTYCGAAI